MSFVQVSNNVINTLSQGILLGWGNYALDLPYVYGNNINNSFINNQITGSQISPLTLTSALTASVVNLAMIDVMCGMFGDNTRQFGWETQNTPFNLAYVYGITFSGNSLTTTPNCQRNLANYAVRPSSVIVLMVEAASRSFFLNRLPHDDARLPAQPRQLRGAPLLHCLHGASKRQAPI